MNGLETTVLELLNWTTHCLKDHQIENPRLNAELLLARSMNLTREGLYVHFNDFVKEKEKEVLEGVIERRISGEPLQYILGHQEFWSIDFKVNPFVLIPRPETELLVEQALWILSKNSLERTSFVLELGTGSGAIVISLAREAKNIFLVATDISMDALLVAKENARSAGVFGRIEFVKGDLFNPFSLLREREPFDLILSNPPYIERSGIQGLPRDVRNYEPISALNGGEDGLAFYRNIISLAPIYLRKGGWLLLEVGQGQGPKVYDMINQKGSFNLPELIKDFSGIDRVVKAQKI